MRRWSFEMLDAEDRPLGELDGVTGGSAEIVAQSPLGGSATLNLDRRQGRDIDWMSHRVRATFHDGEVSWPVGTYLLSSPREVHTAFGLTYEVGLLTKMNIVNEDAVTQRFSLPAGARVIDEVVSLLESTGETRIAATDADVELTAAVTWEPATPKLKIINELLTAAGYGSLWADGSGLFRIEPYVNPADRPVRYTFEHGEASIHYPDWVREYDQSKVPNMFIAVGVEGEDEPPLVGVATNEDPDSPYSYQARGRWILQSDEGVEAASQEIIDAYAARRLRDWMSPVSRMEVAHDMRDLNPNDLVSFTPSDGVRRLATVQRMSMPFEFDADISAEWRQVL